MRFGAFTLLLASLASSTGLVAGAPSATDPSSESPKHASGAASTAPEIPELNPNNFRETISKGHWFVKGYSPYCSHCKAAAPKWQALADYYMTTPPPAAGLPAPKDNSASAGPSFSETYDFHFANLNCYVYDDLCSELNINAWPKFIVFKDGQEWDVYKGRTNDIMPLTKFTEKVLEKIKPGSRPAEIPAIAVPGESPLEQVKPKAEKTEKTEAKEVREESKKEEAPKASGSDKKPEDRKDQKTMPKKDIRRPNPLGKSVNLDNDSFQKRVMRSRDKWFIKFYAPWCGHCQAMAPAWIELGREMEGQLNIGEVNCEVEKLICKEVGVRGYPTIYYFQNGERVEYDGLRGLGDLIDYASKAADSAIKEVDAKSFAKIEKADDFEVAFLYFYDHATTSEDFVALNRLTLNLIGHAPLYKTQDDELAKRFRVYNRPKLMVLRDNRHTFYSGFAPQDLRDYHKVLGWMKNVWLPIVPELSAANSHEIMNRRYVVLGILNRERHDDFLAAKKELREAALEFMDQRVNEERNERKELRAKKQLRIEEAEDRNDERALRAAKNQQIHVPERKEVVFAWVDGIFWERWIKSTYGINPKEEHERIIINDEDTKRYWDVTVDNTPITASRSRILETLKAVIASPPKIKAKSSTGRMESIYYFFANGGHKWLWTFIGVFTLAALAIWGRGRIKRKAAGYFRLDGKEGLGLLGGSGAGKKD